jgi:hypothetical protein
MRIVDESRDTASAEELALETDTAQKIFEILDKDKTLAYVITGVIANDDFSFSIMEEAKEQAHLLVGRSFANANGYIGKFCANINRKIIRANHFPEVRKIPDGEEWLTAIIVFAGYFQAAPIFVSVTFHHQNGISRFTRREHSRFVLGGSGKVMQDMFDHNGMPLPNSQFRRFAYGLENHATLDEAQQFAAGYINACCSPLARVVAPEECKIIGGHIHIAEITPPGRFRWRIPPQRQL